MATLKLTTKAGSLETLRPRLSHSKIEALFRLDIDSWMKDGEDLLDSIQALSTGPLVVRSTHSSEDQSSQSLAGHFYSELNVPSNNRTKIKEAVEKVIESYPDKGQGEEVLIQPQTENVTISGVIFTRDFPSLSPYYVINYDSHSGRTDSVTSGRSGESLMISRLAPDIPHTWRALIDAVKEIESLVGPDPLDIEFALTEQNEVVIFQVRPLPGTQGAGQNLDHHLKANDTLLNRLAIRFDKLSAERPHVSGRTTVFGNMPDWNPAEILGPHPKPLDLSLYRHLVTDEIWHLARSSMGYSDVSPAPLMQVFAGRPYIDVRFSVNSLFPSTLSFSLREKLSEFCLQKLKNNPSLQDKVEFSVYFTCHDPSFASRAQELAESGFTQSEINRLETSLLHLTQNHIKHFRSALGHDLDEINQLGSRRQRLLSRENPDDLDSLVQTALFLLEDCRKLGTLPFSRLARYAFVGKSLLKGFVEEGAITQEEVNDFMASLSTVATHLDTDFASLGQSLSQEVFLERYGHLRPGTYDITSLRYDQDPKLFGGHTKSKSTNRESQKPTPLADRIHQRCMDSYEASGRDVVDFTKLALESREYAKFEFTRNLSDALEHFRAAAHILNLTSEDAAFLELNDWRHLVESGESTVEIETAFKKTIRDRRNQRQVETELRLPPLITAKQDFYVVHHPESEPNFITDKCVTADVVCLDSKKEGNENDKDLSLKGKIVLITHADPGYDWIFTHEPAGLVTQFGGVASHMAIRCAEFELPAAIGCGEKLYNNCCEWKTLKLDASAKSLKEEVNKP